MLAIEQGKFAPKLRRECGREEGGGSEGGGQIWEGKRGLRECRAEFFGHSAKMKERGVQTKSLACLFDSLSVWPI